MRAAPKHSARRVHGQPQQRRATQPTPKSASRTSFPAASLKPPARATVSPPLPHGFLAGATLAPSVQKLPFAALALVSLAIALLALGAVPATAVRHPAAASLLAMRRTELAIGGLALLAASIAAYLLV
jgi:hypothetical protein